LATKSPPQKAGAAKSCEIDCALVVQTRQVVEDVGLDFFWLGFRVNLLQLTDDLPHGTLAVAALDYFEAGAVKAEGAFGHQEHALLIIFS